MSKERNQNIVINDDENTDWQMPDYKNKLDISNY